MRAREQFASRRPILFSLALLSSASCAVEIPESTDQPVGSTALTTDPLAHPEYPDIHAPPALRNLRRAPLTIDLATAAAGTIIAPVSATIDDGGPGFGSIFDTFNQQGLTAGYTAGVTSFDTYLASVPRHSMVFSGFEWFSNAGTTGATVTYDLGAVITIDRLALWNEESSGIGTLNLLSSKDGAVFTPLATGLHPTDNPLTNPLDSPPYAADVFTFPATGARFVRFVISDSPQPDPGSFPAAAIGEIAFRVGSASDLIARTVDWNTGGDGVDFSYEVTDQDLDQDTTVGLFWAKGPSQADIVAPAFSQTADPTVGTHAVHAAAADIAAAPKTATHLLAVVDRDDTIPDDPTNNQVALVLPHIAVTAPAGSNDFRITAEPAMPAITLTLQDVPAAFVSTLSVQWHTEITSRPGDFAHQIATFSAAPIDATVTGSADYQPDFGTQIVGGKLTLSTKHAIAGVALEASSEALPLRILGTQPDAGAIAANVGAKPVPNGFPAGGGFAYSDVLLRIMRTESFGGLQFLGDGSPLFNTTNDGGAGLFQITPPTIDQVWNWQANTEAGANVFNGKLAEAITFIDSRAVTAAAQRARVQFNLPANTPVMVVPPPWTRDVMVLRAAVQRYNGGNAFIATGAVISINGQPAIQITWQRAGNGYHERVLGPLTP